MGALLADYLPAAHPAILLIASQEPISRVLRQQNASPFSRFCLFLKQYVRSFSFTIHYNRLVVLMRGLPNLTRLRLKGLSGEKG